MNVISTKTQRSSVVRSLPPVKDGGDLTELFGHWLNANQNSDCLSRVNIERDQQGIFWLETFSVAEHEPVNWGRVAMEVHQSGRQQSGFHATYDDSQRTVHLVGNYKLGVLVIELFNTFKDDGSQPGTMGREFFRRDSEYSTVAEDQAVTQGLVAVDLTPFAGRWLNTCDTEQWLQHFELYYDQQHWQLRIQTSEFQPDPVAVTSYLDNMGYLAFKANIELVDRQLIIAANTQKALVVMTTFERFSPDVVATNNGPSSTENQVYREIFFHDVDNTMTSA
jgi:hypothetical protein